MFQNSPCVDDIATRYLVDGTPGSAERDVPGRPSAMGDPIPGFPGHSSPHT